jgi:hypothetical protein
MPFVHSKFGVTAMLPNRSFKADGFAVANSGVSNQ